MKMTPVSELEFRRVRAEENFAWDEFVRASPQGNEFLSSGVLQILAAREHPIGEVVRVAAVDGAGRFVAGWAVLRRRRGMFRYCSSFPLFYAGPLLSVEWNATSAISNRTILMERLARCLQDNFDFITTEAAPELPDARGLIYAGFLVEQTYTHVWPGLPVEVLEQLPNRSKRRELRAAHAGHEFCWLPMTDGALQRFDALHDVTLEKFRWVAPAWWRESLLGNMRALEEQGICRLAAARVHGKEEFCAAVSVLLSKPQDCAWLWRVAYETDDPGLIPALYLWVAAEVKREFGSGVRVNFGGSPRSSLALFKDYLGAQATPHWILSWQRPGWRAFAWNFASTIKELFRKRMTLIGWKKH